jgi:hypothetical protein
MQQLQPPCISSIVLHVICILLPNVTKFFGDDCDTRTAFIEAVISRHTPSHVGFITRLYFPHDMLVQLRDTGVIGRLLQPMHHISAHVQNRISEVKGLSKARKQAIAFAVIFEGLEPSAEVLHIGNSPLRSNRKFTLLLRMPWRSSVGLGGRCAWWPDRAVRLRCCLLWKASCLCSRLFCCALFSWRLWFL